MPETEKQTVEQRIMEILKDWFGDEEGIILETEFVRDLGADSLDGVEMVDYLETEFDIAIPDEDVGGLKNVGDMVRYVERRMQEYEI